VRLKIADAETLTSVELGAAIWSFAPEGPLAFLSGREPFLSARLAETSLRFGGQSVPALRQGAARVPAGQTGSS
jgi:hypothetical protein